LRWAVVLASQRLLYAASCSLHVVRREPGVGEADPTTRRAAGWRDLGRYCTTAAGRSPTAQIPDAWSRLAGNPPRSGFAIAPACRGRMRHSRRTARRACRRVPGTRRQDRKTLFLSCRGRRNRASRGHRPTDGSRGGACPRFTCHGEGRGRSRIGSTAAKLPTSASRLAPRREAFRLCGDSTRLRRPDAGSLAIRGVGRRPVPRALFL
jgi:hypothetical protein